MSTPILYQDASLTTFVLDIPRSLEIAQLLPRSPGTSRSQELPSRRIVSSKALQNPYLSLEPKSAKAAAKLGFDQAESIDTLLLQKHVQLSFEAAKEEFSGPWCLPRITPDDLAAHHEESPSSKIHAHKRRKPSPSSQESEDNGKQNDASSVNKPKSPPKPLNLTAPAPPEFHQNHTPSPKTLTINAQTHFIPPFSAFLNGSLTTTLPHLLSLTPIPKAPLILLDPPWPNRSARRKSSYKSSNHESLANLSSLLSSLPIPQLLIPENSHVAVWITNKPAFRELVLGNSEQAGLFAQWGVELVEEWVWLKVTESGEVVGDIAGRVRKPYEVLLIGRRCGSTGDSEDVYGDGRTVKRRTIMAVPDVHSRKPHLGVLFDMLLGRPEDMHGDEGKQGFKGLEIFARNLAAGWMGWGDEVVKFQEENWWVDG